MTRREALGLVGPLALAFGALKEPKDKDGSVLLASGREYSKGKRYEPRSWHVSIDSMDYGLNGFTFR